LKQEKIELELHPEISKWRREQTVDQDLFESIKDKGQLQNLIARRLPNGKIQLLAGQRRYRVLEALGVKPENIDMKVLENVSDTDAVLIALAENNRRQDMSSVEEGRAFKTLMKLKMPIEEIALRNKVSETYVRNRLELLKLPSNIQNLMEKGEIDFSYTKPLIRLEPYGPQVQMALVKEIKEGKSRGGYYSSGIKSVEQANKYVEEVIAKVKHMEELVKKYGPCPVCGGTRIEEERYGEKNKLECLNPRCKHEWHKETKEPWKFYDLKQDANKLGLKVEIADKKATITPEQITDVMKRLHDEREEEKAVVRKTLRSFHSIDEILAPLITPDNLNVIRVEGERVEIRLIQDSQLHFTARRHAYETGEKSIIRPLAWYDTNEAENRKRVAKFIENLKLE
jgi:ParB/RepB/Spo0J family partition protein